MRGQDNDTGGLGERISRLRKARGWSRPELARRAGLDQSTVWRLEATSRQNPGAETLQALAQALDTTIEHLLGAEPRDRALDPQLLSYVGVSGVPESKPQAAFRRIPLVGDPGQPPQGENVVGAVPLPGILELDAGDLFAVQMDQRMADGPWEPGTVLFCAPGARLYDTDTILVVLSGTPHVRELRIIRDALLAQSSDGGELTPITYRDILARVMAVLQKL